MTPNGISDYDTLTQSDFGTGKTNTEKIIKEWKLGTYGEKSESDIWGKISTNEDGTVKWFVPSAREWYVFTLGLGSDYHLFDSDILILSPMYWSSTLNSEKTAMYMSFTGVFDGLSYVWYNCFVRLSTTF